MTYRLPYYVGMTRDHIVGIAFIIQGQWSLKQASTEPCAGGGKVRWGLVYK